LKNNDIQEVHVSLDTHSQRHIAHPGFWEVSDTGEYWVNATDENSKLRELRIDENGNIAGRNLLSDTPDLDILYYRPRRYEYTSREYAAMCTYVQDYIKFFYQPKNKLKQKPMIWPNHCIEKSRGHRVAAELQLFLERWVDHRPDTGPATKRRILKYHNKGRDNLVEMYSAFSADRPMKAEETLEFLKAAYDGPGTPTFYHDADGHANYTNHSTNLNTERNDPLIKHLLRNNNHVYFCGEARTHCVKATLLDVIDVVLENPTLYNPRNVELLQNMSSPIPGYTDDIARIMRMKGFSVSS
jgi:nicotinamidase-related amidase